MLAKSMTSNLLAAYFNTSFTSFAAKVANIVRHFWTLRKDIRSEIQVLIMHAFNERLAARVPVYWEYRIS